MIGLIASRKVRGVIGSEVEARSVAISEYTHVMLSEVEADYVAI